MGLKLEPGELVKDFRKTMDKLAVLCKENRVGNFSSQEFIVDSTFWYWQSCQKKHPNSRTENSDDARATLNGCVHGANYSKYTKFSCPNDNTERRPFAFKESKWLHKSWCFRKNYFNALKSCFDDQKLANVPVPVPRPENSERGEQPE